MKNLVLITIDCLRFDAVSKEYTPFIWNLRKKGLLFTRAYSLGSWTTSSLTGLLTSTYPLMYNGDLGIKYPRVSIVEVLKTAGYLTLGFTFHPYLDKVYGFGKGFDVYYDSVDDIRSAIHQKTKNSRGRKLSTKLISGLARTIGKVPGINTVAREIYYYKQFRSLYKNLLNNNVSFRLEGDKINEIAKQEIANVNIDRPLFLWIHYLDTHFPYLPKTQNITREKIASLNVDRDKWHKLGKKPNLRSLEDLKMIYLLAASDVDRYVEDIIEYFKTLGIYRDTIFIITADHGEEFYEHGGFHHEIKLYEELIHVPLFIFGAGLRSKEINNVVSHLDVFPTVLDIMGIKRPKEWIGENMLIKKRKFVFSEEGQKYPGEAFKGNRIKLNIKSARVAVIGREWKYIRGDNMEELYNLISDPRENTNMANNRNVELILNKLRSEYKSHLNFVLSYIPEKFLIARTLEGFGI